MIRVYANAIVSCIVDFRISKQKSPKSDHTLLKTYLTVITTKNPNKQKKQYLRPTKILNKQTEKQELGVNYKPMVLF
jgi:hypothetical protein